MMAPVPRLTPGERPRFTVGGQPTERPRRPAEFYWRSRFSLPLLACENIRDKVRSRLESAWRAGEPLDKTARSLVYAALAEADMGGVRGLEAMRFAAETMVREARAIHADAHAVTRGAIQGAAEAAASLLVDEKEAASAAAAGVVAAASDMEASEADRLIDGAAGAEARVSRGFEFNSRSRTFNGKGNRPFAH